MITIYSSNAEDFSTLGLGMLTPSECIIEEVDRGAFMLTMTHPMDKGLRWALIENDRIIRAPAPVRETPLVEIGNTGTVTRQIYQVATSSGAKLNLRTKPSTSTGKIIGSFKNGTKVIKIGESGNWYKVIVKTGGATGWMHKDSLDYVGTETETIVGDKPGAAIEPRQTRDQLFVITSVERDSVNKLVTVNAEHISFDLKGNLVNGAYAPKDVAANVAGAAVMSKLMNPHEFTLYATATAPITGDYGFLSATECFLDPDQGIAVKSKARLVRDNFDIFLLADEERDFGVTIRHGKNLTGARLAFDRTNIVTRIVPVGKTKDGDPLYLGSPNYVDSPHINDYRTIYAQKIEYDVQVGDGDGEYATVAAARAKLAELANADFEAGIDLPTVGLEVDFVALENTVEYATYAELQRIHLYDTVHVIALNAGINATVRMTGYTYDAIRKRYLSITLGQIKDMASTVYGYSVADGTLAGTKIATGSIDASLKIRDLTVAYGKFTAAAIEHLSADSIVALKAYIGEIVTGELTTDELYAAFAEIMTLVVKNLEVETGVFTELFAELGNFMRLFAEYGDFDFASISQLVADAMILREGVAGSVYIDNLAATQALFVSATLGELVIKGDDGLYYQIIVRSDGTIGTELVEPTAGEIGDGQMTDGRGIVETTINVVDLNAQNIRAASAIIGDLFVAALTAEKITVGQAMISSATIPELYTTVIRAIGTNLQLRGDSVSIVIDGEEEGTEELLVNKAGGRFRRLSVSERLDAPNMAWRYDGPDKYEEVESLVDILDALNHCYLDMDILIELKDDEAAFTEDVRFIGIRGPGSITLDGLKRASTNGVDIQDCTVRFLFKNLYAEYRETRSPHVAYEDVTESGSAPVTGTKDAVAGTARTQQGNGWKAASEYVWQGYTSGTGEKHRAVFWFPGLSTYAEKTIKNATIRVRRVSGSGKDDPVQIRAYTNTKSSPSGTFSGSTSLGLLGTLQYGEIKTFAIPSAAVPVLCNGGCIYFDPNDDSTLSGKTYSTNYAKFYGVGTAYAPVLSFTYETTGEVVTITSTFVRDNSGLEIYSTTTPATDSTVATIEYFRLHRIGRLVTLNMRYSSAITAGAKYEAALIPVGFRPADPYTALRGYVSNDANFAQVYVTSAGNLTIRPNANISNLIVSGSWILSRPTD